MPYHEETDARIRVIVSRWKGVSSRKMFGGVCHMINGNMFSGVWKDYLILRLGKDESSFVEELPFAKPFDITGKPMKGWVMMEQQGFKTDESLKVWLKKARDFSRTLPAK